MAGTILKITESEEIKNEYIPDNCTLSHIKLSSNKPFVQIIETDIDKPMILMTGLYNKVQEMSDICESLLDYGYEFIFIDDKEPRTFNIKQINTNIGRGFKGLILIKVFSEDREKAEQIQGQLRVTYSMDFYDYIVYIGDNISKTGYSIISEPTI